jgi:alpha-D-ribose 1-methylphosphonate 5-triphosphate synthase subunit PhnL
MTTMIAVDGVGKTFVLHNQSGIRLSVLAGASLSVEAGEAVVLSGPSGAGKSTLLRILYGNYRPTSGQVLVRHEGRLVDLVGAAPRAVLEIRRRTLGWVSQFLRVIPRISALDLVRDPLLARGLAEEEGRRRARDLLARLNVPERLWTLAPATFSGGEQQRINIARGFVADHDVLLLDEPTASLDAANRDVVVELVEAARARGSAIVGIFHDEAVRSRVATRMVDVTSFSPRIGSAP